MRKITVAVVDDHLMILEMWVKLLGLKTDIEIAGASGNFEEAIELIKAKKPDIVLLDINLPPASGLDAVPLIRKFSPGTKIIAVSMHTEPVYAKTMLKLGARGYVTKNSSHEEIFEAIEEVMKGEIFVCAEMSSILVKQIIKADEQPGLNKLSLREFEIIKLIKEGMSSKEIAESLHIAVRTAEVHRQNILKKLNLKNTFELINFINTNDLQF